MRGYMCSIAFDHELGEDPSGTRVYRSLEDLKRDHKCWNECGISVVEITLVNTIEPQEPVTGQILR